MFCGFMFNYLKSSIFLHLNAHIYESIHLSFLYLETCQDHVSEMTHTAINDKYRASIRE